MRVKYKYNVDYLKLCFRQPDGLFEELAAVSEEYIQRDGYCLLVMEKDESHMLLKVLIPDVEESWALGTLLLNNCSTFRGKAFFEFENRALYEIFVNTGKRSCNFIGCLEYVADDLGLEFNNCTKVDIALDTNVNAIARIKKRIRDHQSLDMFLCRHKITNPDEKLQGYGEFYPSSRRRLVRRPELIFGQAREDGTRLKVYDKSRELLESRLDKAARYYAWLGSGWNPEKDRIFRVEVTIRNEDLKDIHAKYINTIPDYRRDMPFLQEIQDEEWLQRYFFEGLESLLYFRDKETGEKVDAF